MLRLLCSRGRGERMPLRIGKYEIGGSPLWRGQKGWGKHPIRVGTRKRVFFDFAPFGRRKGLALEDSDKILNVAGYWTLGIAKGVAMGFVPIMFMGLAAGFTMKVAQTAARVGGMK